MTEISVSVGCDTRLFRAWIRVLAIAAPLLGADRAMRLARRGVGLIRYRFDGGRWHWYRA